MNDLAESTDRPFMPEVETAYLRRHYEAARVILEYGSGGSTRLAASLPGKFVMSVESDRDWAIRLQQDLDLANLPSPAVVLHADVGPTGDWGRPLDDCAWARFHRYPLSVWDQIFFRHPDVVLIDGRFRAACLAAIALRIVRPVTVLFDDYVDRPQYHIVEKWFRPVEVAGRMAVFALKPDQVPATAMTQVFELFTKVTFAKP